jgi:hypothetical protein
MRQPVPHPRRAPDPGELLPPRLVLLPVNPRVYRCRAV